jgi:long-chain acyl-CoA synthetase
MEYSKTPSWTLQTLLDALAARGDAPALISITGTTARSLTCAELAGQVRRLASGLATLGLGLGEPVALLAPNGSPWVMARLALGALGALVTALDDLAMEAELRSALTDSGCRRVMTSAAHVETLRQIDPALQLIAMEDAPPEGVLGWRTLFAEHPSPLPTLSPNTPAMLVYTSGTTGAPKGFVLTYANLWANVRTLTAEHLVGPGDRVLLPLPLHHVYPFVVGFLTPLCSGAAVVLPEAFGGPQIMQALRNADVSAIVGVPRLYSALTAGLETRIASEGAVARAAFDSVLRLCAWLERRHGLSLGHCVFRGVRRRLGQRLRLLVSGGARIEPEVLWPLVGLGFEVRSGYGLAETASIFTGNLPGRERLGSEGRPFAGGELRIAEPDAQGEGEIELRGPSVFSGYRGDVAANREAFTADGWFRTGDLGRVDAQGFLYVTGRILETIVLGGGKKVHPEELEKHYGASPYVRELAVLERTGGLVGLVLPDLPAIRAGIGMRVDDTIRVVLAERARNLPPYQRLAGFALVREPLPRTRLGKYQRFRLPKLYEDALAGVLRRPAAQLTAADQALLHDPRAHEILELLKSRYADKSVDLDANLLLDLGVDSLEWITLGLALQERLGLEFDETGLAGVATVRDLMQLTAASQPVAAGRAKVPHALGPAELRWLAPIGLFATAVGLLIYGLNRLLMRMLFGAKAVGLENLPTEGPFVLVANHASDLDPLILASALGLARMRRIYWGGEWTRLFSRRWLHPLMRALHVFPIDERTPDLAIGLATEVLHRGQALVWFPESWRSPDGTLQRFLPGIGRLLDSTRVPAIPVHIAGSFEAWPRDRRLPRMRPIGVRFGPPANLAGVFGLESRDVGHQRIADALHDAVAALASASGGPRFHK